MKKVISFSLWGAIPKYCLGSVRNARLALVHYPDWVCRFYVDYDTVPSGYLMMLSIMPNVELFDMVPGIPRMMQRFLAGDDADVSRFISRDCDSRIGHEEAAAVNEWIAEDKILHTCRAHPAHARPINGGLFGLTPRRPDWEAPRMIDQIKDFLAVNKAHPDNYGVDQAFLCTTLWAWARISATQHDAVSRMAYPGSKPFPVKWQWPRFFGEVVEVHEDGSESFRAGDHEQINKEECVCLG
jgi:hypothetical protein